MNKGRNLALLMAALLTLSLLTFLTRAVDKNQTAVVDDVRYIRSSTSGNVVEYEFYFIGPRIMEGTLTPNNEEGDGGWTLTVRERIPFENADELEEEYGDEAVTYSLSPYRYTYIITGTEIDNADVTWAYTEGVSESEYDEEPFERFSKRVFVTMLFGSKPIISIPQAFTVAIVALAGSLVIGKAEELWHLCEHKGEDEYPRWEEMTKYKRAGAGVIGLAVVLLIIFVII